MRRRREEHREDGELVTGGNRTVLNKCLGETDSAALRDGKHTLTNKFKV